MPIRLIVLAMLFVMNAPSMAQTMELPLGAVIDWWRPSPGFPIPDGFVVADGSAVSDPLSKLNGMKVPDLRGKFVKGAQNVASIGVTGGAAQHAHQYYILPHVHKWGLTRFNPNDGKTQWMTWTTPMSPNPSLVTIWNNGIGDAGSGNFPMAPSNPRNSDFFTDRETGTTSGVTDPSSSEPPYVGLLKIVKVR